VASGTAVELSEVEASLSARPEISVVVPAYNEAAGLYHGLSGIQQAMECQHAAYELIVVDDGSEDRTADIALQVEGARVLQQDRNRGYGAALKTGIRQARGEVIVITDADGTYPTHCIPALLDELDGADMVVGARTGEAVRIPALRRPAKWLLNGLASLLAESHIPDLDSGLRAFRKDAAMRFMSLLPSGFSFTSMLTRRALPPAREARMPANDASALWVYMNPTYEERADFNNLSRQADPRGS